MKGVQRGRQLVLSRAFLGQLPAPCIRTRSMPHAQTLLLPIPPHTGHTQPRACTLLLQPLRRQGLSLWRTSLRPAPTQCLWNPCAPRPPDQHPRRIRRLLPQPRPAHLPLPPPQPGTHPVPRPLRQRLQQPGRQPRARTAPRVPPGPAHKQGPHRPRLFRLLLLFGLHQPRRRVLRPRPDPAARARRPRRRQHSRQQRLRDGGWWRGHSRRPEPSPQGPVRGAGGGGARARAQPYKRLAGQDAQRGQPGRVRAGAHGGGAGELMEEVGVVMDVGLLQCARQLVFVGSPSAAYLTPHTLTHHTLTPHTYRSTSSTPTGQRTGIRTCSRCWCCRATRCAGVVVHMGMPCCLGCATSVAATSLFHV